MNFLRKEILFKTNKYYIFLIGGVLTQYSCHKYIYMKTCLLNMINISNCLLIIFRMIYTTPQYL